MNRVIRDLASNPHAKVEEIRGQQGCNLNFRRLLNDWEVDRVATLINQIDQLQGLSNCEDSLVWKGSSTRYFSVNSAYKSLMGNAHSHRSWPWKQIWKVNAPTKVLCFVWLVARKACLTNEKLKRRGYQLTSRCYLCGREAEDNSHLFLHCIVTSQLWHMFLSIVRMN